MYQKPFPLSRQQRDEQRKRESHSALTAAVKTVHVATACFAFETHKSHHTQSDQMNTEAGRVF